MLPSTQTQMRPLNWRKELQNDLAIATEKTRAAWLSKRTVTATFLRTVIPHMEAAYHRGRLGVLRERGLRVPPLTAPLSEREKQVAIGAARGLSNAEIGEWLFISEDTIKTHLRRLYTKTGVRTRTGSVALLLIRGDITAGDVLGEPEDDDS